MIRILRGVVAYRDAEEVVLLCGGVGYAVAVPERGVAGSIGDELTLWIRQRVREDSIDLFGFATREELAVFDALQRIPRFAARTALTVIARLGVDGLRRVIAAGDLASLTAIPGVGKKTAQQMLLDLRGQIEIGALPQPAGGGVGDAGEPDDAVQALVQLGFALRDATTRVERARKTCTDPADTSALVKAALKA